MTDTFLKTVLLPLLLLALLISAGCKEPFPGASNVDQSLVGKWQMVRDATLKAQVDYLKQQGLISNNGERQEFVNSFASTVFSFELLTDAEFTCNMRSQFDGGNYSGYWKTDSDQIEMIQTHENGEKKRDKMVGRQVDGQLHMVHQAEGYEVPYIFERAD